MLRHLIRGGCILIAASALLASAAAAARPAHFDRRSAITWPSATPAGTDSRPVRVRLANPFPVFNPQGDEAAETTANCTLTLVCAQHDTHPSDAGYQALARLVWKAPGYHELR